MTKKKITVEVKVEENQLGQLRLMAENEYVNANGFHIKLNNKQAITYAITKFLKNNN